MLRLEVIGPFQGASGYDRHTRELVRQLVALGVRVQLVPLAGWSTDLPEAHRETWFDRLSAPVEAETALHFTMPSQARPRPGRRNVNYTMFEADRIPEAWARAASGHDRIVVPTESSRSAWLASGVPPERLRISPLGVDGEFFSRASEPLPIAVGSAGRPLASFRRRFLNVADLRQRKNHLGLLRTWLAATCQEDDAVLVLKLGARHPGVLERFREDVGALLARRGAGLGSAAPVVFLAGYLTEDELRSLYHSATHYISLSRGEGWDQVMMEAAAAGLELIAPRHSAYISYLGEEDARLIPAEPVPAQLEGATGIEDRVLFDGARWWQPDEAAAAEVVRSIVRGDGPPRPPPRARLLSEYTWEKAARRLVELIEELGPR